MAAPSGWSCLTRTGGRSSWTTCGWWPRPGPVLPKMPPPDLEVVPRGRGRLHSRWKELSVNARLTGPVSAACLFLASLAVGAEPVKKMVKAADGLSIACDVRGKGDTALVFLHGWGGDREYWKNQADAFAEDYTVVTVDQAGHGKSGKDRKAWTVDALAGDVEAVVKDLGLKRVILVGHSMGGPVSLLAAK